MANDTVNSDLLPSAAAPLRDFFAPAPVPVVPAPTALPASARSAASRTRAAPQPEPLPEQVRGTDSDGEEASKFLSKREAARLRAMHETINSFLKIDGIDTTRVHVKDAKVDENRNSLVITLTNGRELECGTHADGAGYIDSDSGPMTQEMAAIGASLCKSRGWTEVTLGTHRPEEERALMAIEAQKLGLKVSNPPADDIMEKVRKELEAAAGPQRPDTPVVASATAPDDNYGRTAPAGRPLLGEPVENIEKWHRGQKLDDKKPFEQNLAAASPKPETPAGSLKTIPKPAI